MTIYVSEGTCRRQRLRFTQSGQAAIEEAYARHFVWPGNWPFPAPSPEEVPE